VNGKPVAEGEVGIQLHPWDTQGRGHAKNRGRRKKNTLKWCADVIVRVAESPLKLVRS